MQRNRINKRLKMNENEKQAPVPSSEYLRAALRDSDAQGDALYADMRAALREASERLSSEVAALDDPCAKLRELARRHLGAGTFLGDYLCVVSGSRPMVEREQALTRLRVRLWRFPVRAKKSGALARLNVELNDCAEAALLLAIDRAHEPQTLREGTRWVKDEAGRKRTFVPTDQYRLDNLAQFEAYLSRTAEQLLDEDIHDRSGHDDCNRDDLPADPDSGLSAWTVAFSRPVEAQVLERAMLRLDPLSAQERRIVKLAVEGHSSDEVCAQLGIKSGTLKSHRHRVRKKIIGAA